MKLFTSLFLMLLLSFGLTAPSYALDAGVTTALTTAAADGAIMGAAVLVVIVGIAAFKFLRRAV